VPGKRWQAEEGPLTPAEQRTYLNAIYDVIAGADEGAVVLLAAIGRLEDLGRPAEIKELTGGRRRSEGSNTVTINHRTLRHDDRERVLALTQQAAQDLVKHGLVLLVVGGYIRPAGWDSSPTVISMGMATGMLVHGVEYLYTGHDGKFQAEAVPDDLLPLYAAGKGLGVTTPGAE
jgi:hypothetical protein